MRKPMWKEGLFIMPQHLQLMDAYHERLIDTRLGMVLAHGWGVSELEIDTDELARGVFRLSRLRAVLPDGALIEIDRDQPLKGLSVTLAGDARAARGVEVFLAMPSQDVGGASPEQAPSGTRYLSGAQLLGDVYRTAADAEIDYVRPNVQLLFGHDNRQNFVTLKLAELVPGESGRLVVSDRYVPPCLTLRPAPALLARLERLVSALAAKQKDLVSKYGGRQAAMVEFGAADLATFWYLHTVNGALPTLMHYAGGQAHPEALYLALATLAGQLSTFDSGSDPLDLPRYDHAALAGTLIPLLDRVLRLLGTMAASRYTVIRLDQTQPGLFVAAIDDPQLLRRAQLYLVAGGDVPEETLRDDVPRYVKAGSVDQIAHIVQAALPGVAVRIDLTPPAAVPVRAHMVYLRLEKQGRYWDAVAQAGTLAIYQPVRPDRVQLELIAVGG